MASHYILLVFFPFSNATLGSCQTDLDEILPHVWKWAIFEMHFQNLGSTQLKHKYLQNKTCYRQMEYRFLISKGSLIHSPKIWWPGWDYVPFCQSSTLYKYCIFFTATIFTQRLPNTTQPNYALPKSVDTLFWKRGTQKLPFFDSFTDVLYKCEYLQKETHYKQKTFS